jgi:glycosyltransferase involved in cell wall biosynthesis
MSNPGATVAVVTRTKDRPLLLRRAIRSVMQQTRRDLHMVIVNDGGDPGPVDEVVAEHQALAEGRVSVVHHERSLGMEAASNAGITATDSTYLCIHDDDDSWHPRFLEATVASMERTGNPGAVTDAWVVFERVEGDEVKTLDRVMFNRPPAEPEEPGTDPLGPVYDPLLPQRRRAKRLLTAHDDPTSLLAMLGYNQFPPIAFCYARRALDTVGLYDESLPVLGDWDFNVRFVSHFDIDYVPRPLAHYHHRHDATGPMVNTIVDGHDDVRRRLLNRYLRADLAAGRLGAGYLANVEHQWRDDRELTHAWYEDQAGALWQLERDVRTLFDTVHTGLRHVDARILDVGGRVDRVEQAVGPGRRRSLPVRAAGRAKRWARRVVRGAPPVAGAAPEASATERQGR